MKNELKALGVIALVLVIGFSMTTCDSGDDRNATQGTPPTIITASLPNGTVGTTYSQILKATGDTPITWGLESGALPTGFTLYASGEISGTATTSKVSTFTVKATNAAGSNTKQLSITIITDSGNNPGTNPGDNTGTNPGNNPGTTQNLSGTITINTSTSVNINTTLTATYSGSETVSYQWKRGETNVGTNSRWFTPITAGSYTVTVSATGYNSKTSAIVDVNNPSLSTLSGDITIYPPTIAAINTTLTAMYSGKEIISYQWEKDGNSVGTNSKWFTPTEVGSYTVTVSATGFNSKTSATITVAIFDLKGTITISPVGPVEIGTTLYARYIVGADEDRLDFFYQWKKGDNVGIRDSQFTPTEAGSYTVTVNAIGYNSKTSVVVDVYDPYALGDITISPNSGVITYTELTAMYSGNNTISYQWEKDGSIVSYSEKFTPTEAGNYTVTVRAGSNSKTSAAVTVTLSDLSGTVTINPSEIVAINTELTATYSGSETVSYQWKKGDTNVGTNSNKFTPTTVGNYTVTVSATGYNSKTSAPVTVAILDLPGTITINPSTNVTIYTELTATYGGSEIVNYQWKKYGNDIGINSDKFTPTEEGYYSVTVSKTGYNSKTSAGVYVALSDLSGTISISPVGPVIINTQLTATYSGSENVNYQWKKDGNNVGTNSNKFTPIEVGNYTVTVSRTGYNSKTSDAITVTPANLTGTIAVNPSTGVNTYTELTATYNGSESVNYQWKKGNINVGTNSNKFTPSEAGDYTVTVSATGYNSKTSATVTVTGWSAVTNSTFGASAINAIAYGNNKFVAGGGGGKMAYSTDGATWTAVTDSTFGTSSINAIAYGNDKFVAVGNDGKIANSTDGVSWTAVDTGTLFYTSGSTYSSHIDAIAYGNNKFVAGGFDSNDGKMATSIDGTTWTVVTTNAFDYVDSHGNTVKNIIWSIAYGNGKFIAGGYNGRKMATSTDGITWKEITQSIFGRWDGISAIVYGNNKFVASSWDGDYSKIATSMDGTTWKTVLNNSLDTIQEIAYGNNKFVAVGNQYVTGGTLCKMLTSTDGVIWTAVSNSTFGKGIIEAIAYGNGKFVAGGSDGKMAYLLDD